mmetsp:Transcript_82644/g.192016  ORF Transcript_82644/g.192016 Transcript_82644/m.192016 type:complete len:203 (+) Transcript_82644:128-736(+)
MCAYRATTVRVHDLAVQSLSTGCSLAMPNLQQSPACGSKQVVDLIAVPGPCLAHEFASSDEVLHLLLAHCSKNWSPKSDQILEPLRIGELVLCPSCSLNLHLVESLAPPGNTSMTVSKCEDLSLEPVCLPLCHLGDRIRVAQVWLLATGRIKCGPKARSLKFVFVQLLLCCPVVECTNGTPMSWHASPKLVLSWRVGVGPDP